MAKSLDSCRAHGASALIGGRSGQHGQAWEAATVVVVPSLAKGGRSAIDGKRLLTPPACRKDGPMARQ